MPKPSQLWSLSRSTRSSSVATLGIPEHGGRVMGQPYHGPLNSSDGEVPLARWMSEETKRQAKGPLRAADTRDATASQVLRGSREGPSLADIRAKASVLNRTDAPRLATMAGQDVRTVCR